MSNHIEVWKTDIMNKLLSNRDFKTFDKLSNFEPITDFNQQTKPFNHPEIRSIDTESELFLINTPLKCDTIVPAQQKVLETGRQQSNKQIYRGYHNHEVNSVCYPNIDLNVWNNTTKAYYQTVEKRT